MHHSKGARQVGRPARPCAVYQLRHSKAVPRAQVGRFSRPLLDYTAAAVRLDLGLTSPQAQWLADGGGPAAGGSIASLGARSSADDWLDSGGGDLQAAGPLLKHRHAPPGCSDGLHEGHAKKSKQPVHAVVFTERLVCRSAACGKWCFFWLRIRRLVSPSKEFYTQGICAGGPRHLARAVHLRIAAVGRPAAPARRLPPGAGGARGAAGAPGPPHPQPQGRLPRRRRPRQRRQRRAAAVADAGGARAIFLLTATVRCHTQVHSVRDASAPCQEGGPGLKRHVQVGYSHLHGHGADMAAYIKPATMQAMLAREWGRFIVCTGMTQN